jgi:endonuclease G, mitochondrial
VTSYTPYQVKVSKIEELTGLSFGSLRDRDPLASEEATTAARSINRLEDAIV